jgi:hypothetical protein
VDDLIGCSVAEALARPIIERVDNEGKFVIADLREVGAFGEVAAQQPIGVLVGPALPGAVRIGEEHAQPSGLFDLFEGGELLAVIERERAAPALGQRRELRDLARSHALRPPVKGDDGVRPCLLPPQLRVRSPDGLGYRFPA